VHVDIKKLGRIPDGGGWKIHGKGTGQHHRSRRVANRPAPQKSYRYLHHAVDDYSRVVYSEILDDEKRDTAAGFWTRARGFFTALGVKVSEVMTDNGSCYRSHAFADALGPEVKHRWTRPYRPQTNGKVERFNRTLMTEWAYARPYLSEASREEVYGEFIDHYNRRRAHTGIGGLAPMDRVHNLTGKYS